MDRQELQLVLQVSQEIMQLNPLTPQPQQEVRQQMPMVVQTKQMGIVIKLKIGRNQHYHPTQLMAIQKVQKLGQVNLKVTETAHKLGQKALELQVEEALKVQNRGQVILKVTETLL